jgi:hypothetical protein
MAIVCISCHAPETKVMRLPVGVVKAVARFPAIVLSCVVLLTSPEARA